MGALGSRLVAEQLRGLGFEPVELERYSTSNKIWATKIKRLRLPDLLCVRTGLRVEVRAKSKLEIRMSHAPNNPDRVWDAGLRDEDIVAFILCADTTVPTTAACKASFFSVADLRSSVDAKQLSALKSATEGSEQHLTWPSTVSSRPGRVLRVEDGRIAVEWTGDGQPARRHTYGLKNRHAYVAVGDVFLAHSAFLAGSPHWLIDLSQHINHSFEPLMLLASPNAGDRYVAAKALAARTDLHGIAGAALHARLAIEPDLRVKLEVAKSAALLGSEEGKSFIHSTIADCAEAQFRMEAIFIATELGQSAQRTFAISELESVVGDTAKFSGDEARQAAVWGLGHKGARAYDRLIPYLTDAEENVALHAIGAFGPNAPLPVIAQLIDGLRSEEPRGQAARSEALRRIGNDDVLRELIKASASGNPGRSWAIATLGRLAPSSVRAALTGMTLLDEVEPLLLLSPQASWLAEERVGDSLRFLEKQSL